MPRDHRNPQVRIRSQRERTPAASEPSGWGRAVIFIRECQECGHEQEDDAPVGEPSDRYLNRPCKKCKSPALDYGAFRRSESDE
jgi:hypothetical protein